MNYPVSSYPADIFPQINHFETQRFLLILSIDVHREVRIMDRVQNRILQDQRRQSRIAVQMECRFKSNEKEYGALMLDLSQGGALLSSTFLPEQGDFPVQENKISITLETSNLKAPLTLSGTIKRSSIGMSEYGKVAQFGVEFENTPLDLLRLISALSARRKTAPVSLQMKCRFISGDNEYEAVLVNLSKEGARLSSAFLPSQQSKISIYFKTDNMEAPMTLEGTVARKEASEGDSVFGVEFENPPQGLSQVISALAAERNKK